MSLRSTIFTFIVYVYYAKAVSTSDDDADDTTPYICDQSIEVVLKKLEYHSDLAISWFESNYMKLNTDKCHLLVSGYKHECVFAKIGNHKIFESNNVKLLGITIDNELRFDKHVSNLCLKANRKLSALGRLARFYRIKSH